VCPRDATPLDDAAEDQDALLGTVLVRLIGEGGMARVYEARHVRLSKKRFAVKVLLPAHAQSNEVVVRFQREAEASSGIGHPNVVDVYDVHRTPEGLPYLVCEYLDGIDLATLLHRRGQIDVLLAVNIARQVCRALSAAHERGIVHRDMKPENVFLVGDPDLPVVKVIDFGISKVNEGGASLTKTGMVMGTPGYMPPEQARGARVDHRADIYGVGAILYHTLTGRMPFDYEDVGEALSAVLTRDPPRPRSLAPHLSPALELVIERAMSKEPADRYSSMDELDAELEPFGAEARASSVLPPEPVGGDAMAGRTATVESSVAAQSSRAGTIKSNAAIARATREANWARPTIALLTLAAYGWTAALLVDALASVVRSTKTEGSNTLVETLLVAIGVGAMLITPLAFWVRHVYRAVWSNSVRAVDTAARLRRVTVSAMLAYAVVVLALRFLNSTMAPGLELEGPGFAFLLLLVSLGAGSAAHLASRARGAG
jgi:serine/threonine-protein kinase